MKILVYGAGPLGSIFSARLQQGGHDVTLLARGERLEALRREGIVLIDARSETRSATQVVLTERLDPEDAYDLVLVIMRKNRIGAILPTLAANKKIPTFLFLCNNAAGPNEYIEALGAERVMLGFPISAGYFEGSMVRSLVGTPDEKAAIPIGEVDGSITTRTREVAAALSAMPGYEVEMRKDMDDWLRTHVALLFPGIAPAFYAAGSDRQRLAETRDLLVLAVRAVREAFHVLREAGYSITPRRLRQFEWLPEPVLVAFLQRLIQREEMEVALAGHARAAQDEVRHLVGEFMEIRARTQVKTPAIDALYPYAVGSQADEIPTGSAGIPMNWTGVWVGVSALATVIGSMFLIGGLLVRRRREDKDEPV